MIDVSKRTSRGNLTLELERDLAQVAQVREDRSFREFVVLLGNIAPNFRRVTTVIDRSWPEMDTEIKSQLLRVNEDLKAISAVGERRPQPKNLFDKVWIGFSNEVRLSLWEFVDAAARFSASLEHALANDKSREAALWEHVKGTDSSFAEMHERSVMAIEQGEKTRFFDLDAPRPKNT